MNNSSVEVSSLPIKDLLTNDDKYVIPMYQRNYAWGTVEIETLIKDIIDAYNRDPNLTYYLGTLVVFEKSTTSQYPLKVAHIQLTLYLYFITMIQPALPKTRLSISLLSMVMTF